MSNEKKIPEGFIKIIKDFVSDIIITFPEYQPIIDKWWTPIINNELNNIDNQQKIRELFDYCIKVFPERFFDILYQKTDIFGVDSQINTDFLPGISFKYLWNCDISDKTRETIWKYLQMVLICIIQNIDNKDVFGDTTKIFNSINEDDFKGKIEETLGNIQNIFENIPKFDKGDTNNTNTNDNSIPPNLPTADDIQSHLNNIMEGKLGSLAREIAEETTKDLDIDMENVTDIKDVFQKLFSNPGKLMGLVKNVSEKLDSRMKSGNISQTELMSETADMMNKMKKMPGMDNIQEILSKMGMGNMGNMNEKGNIGEMLSKMGMGDIGDLATMAGLGKNTKIDTNAMQQKINKNNKQQAFKDRIRKKNEAKNMATLIENIKTPISQPIHSDESLITLFSQNQNEEPQQIQKKKKKKTTK